MDGRTENIMIIDDITVFYVTGLQNEDETMPFFNDVRQIYGIFVPSCVRLASAR